MKGNHSKKKKVNIQKLLQSNVSMEMQSNVKREKYLPWIIIVIALVTKNSKHRQYSISKPIWKKIIPYI